MGAYFQEKYFRELLYFSRKYAQLTHSYCPALYLCTHIIVILQCFFCCALAYTITANCVKLCQIVSAFIC